MYYHLDYSPIQYTAVSVLTFPVVYIKRTAINSHQSQWTRIIDTHGWILKRCL